MKLEQAALGKLLREARRDSGLTIEGVCTKSGLPPSLIYRAETGGDLMLKSIVRLLDAYGLEAVVEKKDKPLIASEALLDMGLHDIDWKAVGRVIRTVP